MIHIVPHCALILIDRLIDKNKNYLRDIPSFRLRTFFEMRYFLIYQCQLKRNLKYQFDVINVLSGWSEEIYGRDRQDFFNSLSKRE